MILAAPVPRVLEWWVMDSNCRTFRVGLKRRVGYPCAMMAVCVAALIRWQSGGDPALLAAARLLAPLSVLLFWYLNSIRLSLDAGGILLRWPFQRDKAVKWDKVVQVRRSQMGGRGQLFIDIIESADRSVQFNPWLFDRPDEIIDLLNRYLDSDLFTGNEGFPGRPGEELAVAAEETAPASPWTSILVVVVVALLLFVLMQMKIF